MFFFFQYIVIENTKKYQLNYKLKSKSIPIPKSYHILFYYLKKLLYQLYHTILQYSQHPNFYFFCCFIYIYIYIYIYVCVCVFLTVSLSLPEPTLAKPIKKLPLTSHLTHQTPASNHQHANLQIH